MSHIIKALDREAFGLGTKVPALPSLILRGVILLVHSVLGATCIWPLVFSRDKATLQCHIVDRSVGLSVCRSVGLSVSYQVAFGLQHKDPDGQIWSAESCMCDLQLVEHNIMTKINEKIQ
jgi:hypothetical protein